MRVFNTCMLIMKRNLGAMLMYIIIFIPMLIVMSVLSSKQYNLNFEEAKPEYTIINHDVDTPVTEGLEKYLSSKGSEVKLEDNREALQDASFFHETEYIIIIPEGFSKALFTDAPMELETVQTPDSTDSYYMRLLVDQYFNLVTGYHKAAPELGEAEIAARTLNDLSIETAVEKINYTGSTPVSEKLRTFFRFVPYILMMIIILCTSTIMMAFSKPQLRMRNMSSPLRPFSLSMQLILYYCIISLICWVLICLLGLIVNINSLSGMDPRILALLFLNTFIYMIVSIAVSSMVCSFIKNETVQNAVANILSLVFCFLGGIFVPLEMFDSTLSAVGKFIPTYWYSMTLDSICSLSVFTRESITPIMTYMLLQLGFAATFICIALVINKRNQSAEESFGSVKTEIDG